MKTRSKADNLLVTPSFFSIQTVILKAPCPYYKKLYELAKAYNTTISHIIRNGIFYVTGIYEVPRMRAKGSRKYDITSNPDECKKLRAVTTKLSTYTIYVLDKISMNSGRTRTELILLSIDRVYELHKEGKLVILPEYYGV